MRLVELLAPAKNLECGIAAIEHGADAVYIGSPKFGARKQAGNSLDDLSALIEKAHLYKVKVYVAFNTLLFDHELKDAENLIHQIYQIGADALIIQDMGILEMDLPPIPLHASTQTDNRTVEKVNFLEKSGFDQVVLARELSLEQIKNISSNTQVKLECFVHGALCVCYSGQCYMSQSINGRSANRGECGQPCRLPYNLSNASGEILVRNKHVMSLKDMNLSLYVGQLIDAGVTSLKIEGRLKEADYVKNITAYYRREIDKALESRPDVKPSSIGISSPIFEPNPEKSFSRGFTSYFFNGRGEQIWNLDSPKSLGEKVGKVAQIEKDHFVMAAGSINLNNGDGLCFFSKQKELVGIRANRIDGRKVYPVSMKDLYAGANIFRNHDQQFEKILNASDQIRKIRIDLELSQLEDGFELSVVDEDGQRSVVKSKIDSQPAINQNADEMIKVQLSKTGGTPFMVNQIQLHLEEPLFIPAKALNALRREVLDVHLGNRIQLYERDVIQFKPTNHDYVVKKLDFSGNVLNEKSRQFYLRHGVENVEWGFELQKLSKGRVMSTKYCILDMMDCCLKKHPEMKNQVPFVLYNDKDKYQIETNCKDCEMYLTKM